MEVLVFKTNLANNSSITDIESYLDIHPYIKRWNVDRKDRDNILRVESNGIAGTEIENILLNAGYYCEELD